MFLLFWLDLAFRDQTLLNPFSTKSNKQAKTKVTKVNVNSQSNESFLALH